MKKTLIAVAMVAFVSTGAIAKPMPHNAPQSHNNHSVHMVSHAKHPAPHAHHYHAAPAPLVVHHSHHHNDGAVLLGDMIIAFAILASNAM